MHIVKGDEVRRFLDCRISGVGRANFGFYGVVSEPLAVQGDEHVPEAADEVCDNDGDDNQSENLEHIQHHILRHDSLVSGCIAHQRLDQLVKPLYINQFNEPWQPEETE